MPSFPDRLKELRKSKKLKQTDMALFLGFNVVTYQRYEYGHITPNAPILTKLAEYINVSTDYLLGLTDCPDRK